MDFKMEFLDMGIVCWIFFVENKLIKVIKWKVKKGLKVGKGGFFCLYEMDDKKNLKLKLNMVGIVLELKDEYIFGRLL